MPENVGYITELAWRFYQSHNHAEWYLCLMRGKYSHFLKLMHSKMF